MASCMLLALSFRPTIFPLSNLNKDFFFASYSFGSIPVMRSIRSSPAPIALRSFSIPLNILIVLLPPNNLLRAFCEEPHPSVTRI